MKLKHLALAGLVAGFSHWALAQGDQPATPEQPSSAAQQLYANAQRDLLQLRVLLKNGDSQSSVGSGFLIGNSRLVVTNYHVVSQIALEPETYIGQYKSTDGKSGSIELLAVDVLHDLAVVRVDRQGSGFFQVPTTGPWPNWTRASGSTPWATPSTWALPLPKALITALAAAAFPTS